jgi:ribosomal protein RSM22 (predicted rRNA methylase)
LGKTQISWQRNWREDNIFSPEDARNSLALSAFTLSSLPTDLARKQLVKEMWQSGAEVLVSLYNYQLLGIMNIFQVLIDHSTPQGFEAVTKARQALLDLGEKEGKGEQDQGCHVIAPVRCYFDFSISV